MAQKSSTIQESVAIPGSIRAQLTNCIVTIKGPKGEVSRKFINPQIKLNFADNKITVTAKKGKREKTTVGTTIAHIKNMVRGVETPYNYTLKICSGHFPMTVAVQKDSLVIKNFFGEHVPRTLPIKKGAAVKVEGDFVEVESVDKDLASQVAADIEKLTRRTAFDRRIFQDGVYIIKKDGKEIK